MILLPRSRLCIITLQGVASNYLHSRLKKFSAIDLNPKVLRSNAITYDRCKEAVSRILPLHDFQFVTMIRCPIDRAWYYAKVKNIFPQNQVEPKTQNDYVLLSNFIVSLWTESYSIPKQSDIVRLDHGLKIFDYSRVELFWQFINVTVSDDYPRFKQSRLAKPVKFFQAPKMSFERLTSSAQEAIRADYDLYHSAFSSRKKVFQ